MANYFKEKASTFNAGSILSSMKEGVSRAADTSSKLFDRARQFTEEKLSDTPKTELQGLEEKNQQAQVLREQTELLHKSITRFLQAGSGFSLPKIDRHVIDNLVGSTAATKEAPATPPPTPYSGLAEAFSKAASAHGYIGAFGRALGAMGEAEHDIGKRYGEFRDAVADDVAKPLEAMLTGQLKATETKEHDLKLARLDLDAAKRKVREANTADKMTVAENELRKQQYHFDRIYNDLDVTLDTLQALPVDQLARLREFTEQQRSFHAHAQEILDALLASMPTVQKIESEMAANTGVPAAARQATPISVDLPPPVEPVTESPTVASPAPSSPSESTPKLTQRARALYDYDPTAPGELELTAGQEVTILQRVDADWVIAQHAGAQGKVPIAYLLIMNK